MLQSKFISKGSFGAGAAALLSITAHPGPSALASASRCLPPQVRSLWKTSASVHVDFSRGKVVGKSVGLTRNLPLVALSFPLLRR